MGRFLAGVFAVVVFPVSVALAVITPPGQVADEPAHIIRAASVLYGQVIGHRSRIVLPNGLPHTVAGVDVDPALLLTGYVLPPRVSKLSQDRLEEARKRNWTRTRQFIEISIAVIYPPIFYVPAALGLGSARLFGARPFDAVIVGRLLNSACFTAMAMAALLLARRGQALLFCTLALPMTVSLAGSFNQDSLLIAASALAAALLSRSIDEDPQQNGCSHRPFSYLAAALLLAIVIIVKLPYLPLAAMLLVPLPRFRQWVTARRVLLRRFAVVALVALPAATWVGFAMRYVGASLPRAPYFPGPLWPGDPDQLFTSVDLQAQLSVLAANPLRLVTLPVSSMMSDPWLLKEAIGVLGWLDVSLPHDLYTVWAVGLVAACVVDLLNVSASRRWLDSAVLLVGATSCVLAIYVAQYLLWTSVGMTRIEGVQGRYLLPILPMLALALPPLAVPGGAMLRRAAILVPVAAAVAGLITLPMVIVSAYYLR
ncbi:MAG: hypothetical protein C5B48_09325 [Candidatus Rokuibacteriota bacterium]|nr:MAG: hypothetical protein C5B48_09325 [Candidatus Rokubacteria bacterium]